MQSMAEIHRYIQMDYKKLENAHDDEKKTAKETLYSAFPRIEEIDREISMLAINSAKMVLKENISPVEAEKRVKHESDRLKSERKQIISENNIKEFTPEYRCKKCSDTGYIMQGVKCTCYIKRMQMLLALPGENKNDVLNVLKDCDFSKFDLSYYPKNVVADIGYSPYNLMRVNYAECIKFADEFTPSKSGSVLMYGPPGLGKTFLAGCIFNRVCEKGYFAMYKSSYKLFQFLDNYKFQKADKEENSVIYSSIYDCDLLIIDDFGTEFITSYTQAVFFDLLNTRLVSGKSTIISTNLTFDQLSDIYQNRVMSRLENEFKMLRFEGNDIRAIKNNK